MEYRVDNEDEQVNNMINLYRFGKK